MSGPAHGPAWAETSFGLGMATWRGYALIAQTGRMLSHGYWAVVAPDGTMREGNSEWTPRQAAVTMAEHLASAVAP